MSYDPLNLWSFDHLDRPFLLGAILIVCMGFGPPMPRLVLYLGQNVASREMLNSGATPKIPLAR